jgi:hypothetical protein
MYKIFVNVFGGMNPIKSIAKLFRDFIYGAVYLDLYKDSLKMAKQYEDFINLLLLGDFLGVPILSNSVTIRLIPYLYKDLMMWRVRQLKERDVTDEVPDVG